MTDEQRTAIGRYRKAGYGYKKIGQLTGISENTVKTYCRRNGLGGLAASVQDTDGGSVCKCCGAAVRQTPGRKEKKFCSNQCRMKWWNSHLDQVNRKAMYEFTCPTCGKEFSAYGNRNRKYCSHECYIEDRFGGGRR